MTDTTDFLKDLPVADIRIGPNVSMRIYGFNAADMGVPLVEIRCAGDHLHLTVEQAEKIAAGLLAAAKKARV